MSFTQTKKSILTRRQNAYITTVLCIVYTDHLLLRVANLFIGEFMIDEDLYPSTVDQIGICYQYQIIEDYLITLRLEKTK